MKKIYYLLCIIMAAGIFASCQKDDAPQLTKVVAPTMNALTSDTIYTNDRYNSLYTFTWSAARFYVDNNESATSLGSYENGGINYDLQVDLLTGDFSSAVSVGQTVSNLYMNVTPADLRALVTKSFGVEDEKVDLKFRVVATYGSNSSSSVVSENIVRATLGVVKGGEAPVEDNGLYEPDFNDGLMNHKIYVEDNSGWGDLSIYCWADGFTTPDGWPGVHYSSEVTIGGTKYKVFDMPEGYQHQKMNFIFNNNNGGKQFDAMQGFTFGHDLFLTITESSFTSYAAPVRSDGFTVYANIDESGWPGISFYAWTGSGDFETGWPGADADGTVTINSKLWYYHTFHTTDVINVILNNRGSGSQTSDISINYDAYVTVASNNSFKLSSGLYK